jgi:hypothetical protein
MTAVILGAGILLGAAAIILGRRITHRERDISRYATGPGRTRLERELSGHELGEAMRRVEGLGMGGTICGCRWAYLADGEAQMFPCERHEAMLRAVREEGL